MVENVRIFTLETRGVETVKELKEQIKDLRQDLVKLDQTSEDYEKTLNELIEDEQTLERVMKVTRQGTVAATGSYNALVEEMTALKRVWREVTDESQRAKIGKRIAEINVELKQMDATIGNFQRNVGDYENSLKKVFLTPQQELKKLRNELAQLTEGTEEYNKVFMRMADLTTKVQKQQELLRYSSADLGNILSNLAGVASGVIGGFSAINAAMGLMGSQDEDVQKAMLKVQQMMALVQGLSAMEGLGDKINGLWKGIKKFIDGFRGGTAAVSDFNKTLSEADGAVTKTTSELNTQATTLSSNVSATERQVDATNKLATSTSILSQETARLGQAFNAERNAILESTMSAEEKAKALDRINAKQLEYQRALAASTVAEKEFGTQVSGAAKKAYEMPKVIVETNNIFKLLRQNLGKTKKEVVEYTTQNKLAAGSAKLLAGGVNAVNVAIKAIGIGLVIAAITALLGVLMKGVSALWKWVSGQKAAAEATEQVKNATEELNKTLEANNDEMDFQSRLMDAQGKDYQEIYEYKKQQITANLSLAKAQLAESLALEENTKKTIFNRKARKELTEAIEEQKAVIAGLEKDLTNLDRELVIHNAAEETRKRNSGGGGGGSSYDAELKSAQKLYESLLDWYKTDRQKLRETYEANKATIEKYIKDKDGKNKALLALEQKYYADLKKIHNDNMEAIYNVYLGQEKRRLALMNVWGDKYLERAKEVLDEQHKIDIAYAAKRVGFEEKTAEQIAHMDAATKKEYLDKQKLFNNEKFLIDQEYEREYNKLIADHNTRLIEEGRRAIEIKKENAKTDEEVLAAEIELAEYDLANVFQKEGESANEYQLRVIALSKALEELQKKKSEVGMDKDWTQLRLDNDAEAARINNGDQSMQYLQARLTAAQYFYDNLKQLDGESLEEFRQRNLEALSAVRDAEKAILQQRFDNWSNLANGIGDIMGSIADMYMTDIQAQKDADGQYNAESKRKFEYVKRLQIAQAVIQTISGAIAAFMGCQSLGQPWGAILGAVQAAAVTAAGMAQIAQIKKQTLDGGGNVESVRYATATPSITDYNPEGVTNVTGGQETEALANALAKTPIRAYVVESEVTASQELAQRRVSESTF